MVNQSLQVRYILCSRAGLVDGLTAVYTPTFTLSNAVKELAWI